MASLINGSQLRERLQDLLKTSARNGKEDLKSEEEKTKGDEKLSYTSSFTRGN